MLIPGLLIAAAAFAGAACVATWALARAAGRETPMNRGGSIAER
jgi:hypothetical protein